jgi:hypothetical protein
MAKYIHNCSKGKISEDVVGFMARERDIVSPYQSPDLSSGITRECSEETSAADFNDFKTFFVDIAERIMNHQELSI